MEVEFTIVTPHFAPTLRLFHDATHRAFKLVNEIITETPLTLFIPQRRSFQLLFGFRMTDDVHAAWREYP